MRLLRKNSQLFVLCFGLCYVNDMSPAHEHDLRSGCQVGLSWSRLLASLFLFSSLVLSSLFCSSFIHRFFYHFITYHKNLVVLPATTSYVFGVVWQGIEGEETVDSQKPGNRQSGRPFDRRDSSGEPEDSVHSVIGYLADDTANCVVRKERSLLLLLLLLLHIVSRFFCSPSP